MSGRSRSEPFWERTYGETGADTFGPPAEEVLALIPRLPAGASVLDLGCGDGRNALPLAAAGFRVTAVDKSVTGIEQLERAAAERGLDLDAVIQDLRDYRPTGDFDLVITHGVLHLLTPEVGKRLLADVKEVTRKGGWNVHAVFTDRLPQPADLAPFVLCPFAQGALARAYEDWAIELAESYILEDEHPGGIRHRHAIDKIVARRP